MDGVIFGEHHVLVAVGVDAEGHKHVLGLAEGASENQVVVKGLTEDLVRRGVKTERRRGRWVCRTLTLYTPRGKKRTALLRKLKPVFPSYRSQPVSGLIEQINPILCGWVNYFAVGHSSRCFSYIRNWVEKKIRCHLARARQRKDFGWERWSGEWLYGMLGLFSAYRVVYQPPPWVVTPIQSAP